MRELPLILALDVAGNPHRWIGYEDAAYYYAKELVAWSMGEENNYTLHGGVQRISGERSFLTMDTIIAIKGQVNNKRMHLTPNLTNKALFRRDINICGYCGDAFGASHLTRDHINPKTLGGIDKWENVVTACAHCNKRKGGRTPEGANMKLLYIPYAPCRNEHLILMNRKILTNQMDYLMKSVPKHSRLHA